MTERIQLGENVDSAYSYGKFERTESHEKVEQLAHDFKDHYAGLGYVEIPEVDVSSGVDPSVRFIGSHISVFKPEIIEKRIHTPGEYMIQECIRTKNVREIFNDNYFPSWGSSFRSLGAISNYNRLHEITNESIDFFLNKLKLDSDNIRIRISSKDQDLLTIVSNLVPDSLLEVDTQPDNYYKHKIGIEGVVGRNFNIALRSADSNGFSDVGNIIVLENDQEKLGVETALGTSTILKQLYGLDHVNDCYPINLPPVENQSIRRKLEDSIIVSTKLFREGLAPRATDNRERLLRTYVRAISYLRIKGRLSLEDITLTISGYESRQFPGVEQNVASSITSYIADYEQELLKGKISTKEDEIIASVLKR